MTRPRRPPREGRTAGPPTDPGDLTVPVGPAGLETPDGDTLVSRLDVDVPLLLLPVRIVTRFLHNAGPQSPPTHLGIRVFPDVIHADRHDERLSADEIQLGRAYWTRLWRAGGDPAARAEAHSSLFAVVGAPRAVWVIAATTPLNPGNAPKTPVPADKPLAPPPKFPAAAPATRAGRVLARLLPERWCATVYSRNEQHGRWWSEPVRADLALAPALADLPDGGTIEDLLTGDATAWLRDFTAACDAGMGLRVPLDAETRRGPIDVVVAGARRGIGHGPELTDLLDAQRLSDGIEIVRPGTPTNTTETVQSGFTALPADPERFLADQLWTEPAISRPELTDPAVLARTPAADALALAFGLEGATAFDRSLDAGNESTRAGRAMNRALWPATVRATLTGPLARASGPVIDADDLSWAREWFGDWVRGGGPLPAFRVGTQPYAVLPVTPRATGVGATNTRVDNLDALLDSLWDSWTASVANVAALTPVGGEAGTPDEQAVAVASVLGAVPHPTAFRLREAPEEFHDLQAEWNGALDDFVALLETTSSNALDEFHDREPVLRGSDGIVGQQSAVSQLITLYSDWAAGGPGGIVDFGPALDHLRTVLRPLLAAHDYRSDARRYSEGFGGAPLADQDDPPLWYTVYGDDGTRADGSFDRLRLVPGGDAAAVAARLREYAADARSITATTRPDADLKTPRPLLWTLAGSGLTSVAAAETEDMADGLESLADLVESGSLDPGGLERVLRETLGLSSTRYDAWKTSVATHRLAGLRAKAPTGLQVGCFGWVLDLVPDEGGPDTSGFVHAPSLDHAATAAVLRSSWLAFADDGADAAFAVDLSSDRLRRATWLLDGVRNGLDLGELLGARFERRLHDAGLDPSIDDIRDAVRGATPSTGVTSGVVDGLALAVAYTDSALAAGTDPVLVAVEAVRTGLPAAQADRLQELLREGVADLDAVADALLAQSVHSLVKGNLAQAAAALSAGGSGDSGVPELSVGAVHRESQVISHRVVAAFPPPPADPPPASGLFELAEPALAAWLRSLLPRLGSVPVAADVVDAAGASAGAIEITLAEAGLTAIEVVGLAPADGNAEGSLLTRLVAAIAARSRPAPAGAPEPVLVVHPERPTGATTTLADLTVAAGALREAVGRARPLRPDDLVDPDTAAGDADLAELSARRDQLAGALAGLGALAPSDDLLRERLRDLLAVSPEATLAALETADPATRVEAVAAVLAAAVDAAATLSAAAPEGWDTWSSAARVEHVRERMQGALGLRLPVCPRFTPANGDALRASASRSGRRLGRPSTAATWLLESGRVHDGAGALGEAIALAEAALETSLVEPSLVQLPDVEDELWVARHRASADGGRLCVLSITPLGPALAAGSVAGLLFDAWSESLPGRTATTGVAVHLDSPGARPPQTLLLACADPAAGWDTAALVALLRQTLSLAEFRAIGSEALDGWGQTLPGIFLPREARVAVVGGAPEETTS